MERKMYVYDVEERIKLLKIRPGMCVGKQNVTVQELFIYIMGFCQGRNEKMTQLEHSFYRCFAKYVYDWMDENNILERKEFTYSWYKYFDQVDKDGTSLFYSICEKFFSEYHSNSLNKKYLYKSNSE